MVNTRFSGLTGNQLKLLALVAMTVDHIGVVLFPHQMVWRVIGRLAFPIYAWFIAEGCRYTGNRKKYLLTMAGLAAICQVVYLIALGSLYQCILVTFTLAIGWIYVLDGLIRQPDAKHGLLFALTSFGVLFLSVGLPRLLPGTDYAIDYGFWGILLPLLVYAAPNKPRKLAVCALVLVSLCLSMGSGVQWCSLLALIPLALYNGHRGKLRLKYLFYLYYPLHLVVIYGLSMLLYYI